jgi:NAD(P)H dehydrogenase (quinone)
LGDYDRPESLAQAYAGLDRLLIITTVAPEPGKRGAQNVAAIDAAVKAGVKHINATGPERLSGADRASLIADIMGRSLAFRVVTEEQLRAGLTQAGLPAGAVNIVAGIQASFAAGAFDILTGDVERLGGRPPKPLRDVLEKALKSPSA